MDTGCEEVGRSRRRSGSMRSDARPRTGRVPEPPSVDGRDGYTISAQCRRSKLVGGLAEAQTSPFENGRDCSATEDGTATQLRIATKPAVGNSMVGFSPDSIFASCLPHVQSWVSPSEGSPWW